MLLLEEILDLLLVFLFVFIFVVEVEGELSPVELWESFSVFRVEVSVEFLGSLREVLSYFFVHFF